MNNSIANKDELGKIYNKNKVLNEFKIADTPVKQMYLGTEPLLSDDDIVTDSLLSWTSGLHSDKTTSYWSDISGNNNHLTVSNGTVVSNGYLCNGVNTLFTSPFNLNTWANGGSLGMVVKNNVAGNYRGLGGDHNSNYGLVFCQYENNLCDFGFYPPNNANFVTQPNYQSVFKNGNYVTHEIYMTYDKQNLKVYSNGELVISKSVGQIGSSNTNKMVFGRSIPDNSTSRYHSGYIYDIKYYGKALTSDEILQNHNVSLKGDYFL